MDPRFLSLRGRARGALGVRLALAGLLVACRVESAPPSLERIDPPRGLHDRRTPIVLTGARLDVALEESGVDLVVPTWTGSIGPRALERVTLVSAERIDAVVPPGVPSGVHDVVLRMRGHELHLSAAFTSVPPIAPRIDSVEPSTLPSTGGELVVRGAGLHFGSVVAIREIEVPTTWVDEQTLRVAAPPGELGAAALAIRTPLAVVRRGDLLNYASESGF